MTKIFTPYGYSMLDLEKLCRNYTQTPDGEDVRMGNNAASLILIAQTLNRALARIPRIWAQQMTKAGYEGTTSSDPYYEFTVVDLVKNARNYYVRIVAFPRTDGTGDAYAGKTNSTEMTPYYGFTFRSASYFQDAFFTWYSVNRGAPYGDERFEQVSTFQNFRILDIVIQDEDLALLDTGEYEYVNPKQAVKGQEILANLMEQIREKLFDMRTRTQPVFLSWSARRYNDHWYKGESTNTTGIVVTSSTYVNVINQNHTSRDAMSPGISCPAQYCGRGTQSETAGQQLKVKCRVLGMGDGDDAVVKFEGPLDNVEITMNDNDCQWYGSSSDVVYLDTTVADTDETTARNKIDIFAKIPSGTCYIWGLSLEGMWS